MKILLKYLKSLRKLREGYPLKVVCRIYSFRNIYPLKNTLYIFKTRPFQTVSISCLTVSFCYLCEKVDQPLISNVNADL